MNNHQRRISTRGVRFLLAKYLNAFNSRVKSLLVGFDDDVKNTMLSKIVKKKTKDDEGMEHIFG